MTEILLIKIVYSSLSRMKQIHTLFKLKTKREKNYLKDSHAIVYKWIDVKYTVKIRIFTPIMNALWACRGVLGRQLGYRWCCACRLKFNNMTLNLCALHKWHK